MHKIALASVSGVVVAMLVAGWTAACGGADSSDVTNGGNPDSGTPPGVGSSGNPGSSQTGSQSPDAGAIPDASSGARPSDGGTDPVEAGPGGDTTTLTCGATSCAIPAQTCCIQRLPAAGVNFSCVGGSTCPGVDAGGGGGGGDVSTAALQCASQANCAAGSVCCFTSGAGGRSIASSCTTGTACPTRNHELCDPTAPAASNGCTADTGPCSSGNHSDFGLPAGFGACGGFPH